MRSRSKNTPSKSGREIRYAVVGLGHIAQVAVLPAFDNAPNSELAAVVSSDETKREQLTKIAGGPTIAGCPAHGPGRALISLGPGRWSGQSGKELVLAEPFLHPETERQAAEVSRSCSGVLLERRSLAWLQVPCAEQWLTVG